MRSETVNQKKYFEKRFEIYGSDIKSLAWSNQKSQQDRFEILTSLFLTKTDFSVLDVGCGFGDFCSFLSKNDYDSQYCGIDLVPAFLNEAKKRSPDTDFRLVNILKDSIESFDYVIASGIFSIRMEEWGKYMTQTAEKMFEICKIGLGITFLSDLTDNPHPNAYYADPAVILEYSFTLSPKVILRHDYRLNDFTVLIFK